MWRWIHNLQQVQMRHFLVIVCNKGANYTFWRVPYNFLPLFMCGDEKQMLAAASENDVFPLSKLPALNSFPLSNMGGMQTSIGFMPAKASLKESRELWFSGHRATILITLNKLLYSSHFCLREVTYFKCALNAWCEWDHRARIRESFVFNLFPCKFVYFLYGYWIASDTSLFTPVWKNKSTPVVGTE